MLRALSQEVLVPLPCLVKLFILKLMERVYLRPQSCCLGRWKILVQESLGQFTSSCDIADSMFSSQSFARSCKEKGKRLSLITSLETPFIFTVPHISMKDRRFLCQSSMGISKCNATSHLYRPRFVFKVVDIYWYVHNSKLTH